MLCAGLSSPGRRLSIAPRHEILARIPAVLACADTIASCADTIRGFMGNCWTFACCRCGNSRSGGRSEEHASAALEPEPFAASQSNKSKGVRQSHKCNASQVGQAAAFRGARGTRSRPLQVAKLQSCCPKPDEGEPVSNVPVSALGHGLVPLVSVFGGSAPRT
jgi:hypothetical protein